METEAAKGIAEEAVNGGRRDGAGRGAAASVAAQLIDLRGRVEAAAWDEEEEGREQKWGETESMMMPPDLSLSRYLPLRADAFWLADYRLANEIEP